MQDGEIIPAGTIGIPSADPLARYHGFTMSLSNLVIPAGSRFAWAEGLDTVDNLQRCIQMMGDEDDWCFILDDDATFEPDILMRLLSRMYGSVPDVVDIVVGFTVSRHFPFHHVCYEGRNAKGFVPVDLSAHDPEAFIEVVAAGSAGMVIRRRVITAMDGVCFKYGPLQKGGPAVGHDLRFCEEARALGFRIWADLGVRLGHIRTVTLLPDEHESESGIEYGVALDFGHGDWMFVPKGLRS